MLRLAHEKLSALKTTLYLLDVLICFNFKIQKDNELFKFYVVVFRNKLPICDNTLR